MKKAFMLLMWLFVSGVVCAQTPQYSLSGGTSSNTIPLMSTTNRVQWVYTRADFAGLPTGSQLITKLYLRSGTTTASATYTNLTIRIGHTNLTTFPNGTFVTGLTTVFLATSHTLTSVTAGGWVVFNLQTPFTYNGTQNLIVEVSQTAYTGGITVRQNTAGGNRRIFGTVVSSTGTASTGIADLGLDLYPIFACAKSTPLSPANITSNAASLRWTPVAGAVSYDYILSTTPNWPNSGWTNTSSTSVSATGLNPSTNYYLLVRSRCSATTFSFWDTISFRTLPPCTTPSNFKVTRLDSNNADISWRKVPTAQRYQYIVDKTRATPIPIEHSMAVSTTDTFAKLNSLSDAVKYYVHIRSLCAGNDSSAWSLDSFTTPRNCKTTFLKGNILSKNAAIIFWDTIQTSVNYEYVLSLTPDIPAFGTPLKTNFNQFNALRPDVLYYMHCRSKCEDVGITAYSPWTTLSFSTTSLGVAATNLQLKDEYSVYPNPVKNSLFIDKLINRNEEVKYELTDIVGHVIKHGTTEPSQTVISTSDMAQGVYLLKLHNNNQSVLYKILKE